jgi:hypothetical protein
MRQNKRGIGSYWIPTSLVNNIQARKVEMDLDESPGVGRSLTPIPCFCTLGVDERGSDLDHCHFAVDEDTILQKASLREIFVAFFVREYFLKWRWTLNEFNINMIAEYIE